MYDVTASELRSDETRSDHRYEAEWNNRFSSSRRFFPPLLSPSCGR